ncbi:GapS1 family protein [Escherichia coli]|uniref:GapS1 family protein n=1 Tax=Escherichia coli TaxID=562 RepID=UPI001081F33E|nr:hypothetical protein [Escherichia coli]TGJ34247.1 hypothetical protein E5P25_20135 [Escherichia coli]TGJ48746.1 hypothetical protein E5P24_11805 [Escherichia coli]
MSVTIKTMTPVSYSIKVDAIKKRLSYFSDVSFLRNFYEHFQKVRDVEVGIVSNFPWCCYLAMKWKFCMKEKKPAKEMSKNDFIDIINLIYNLQLEASNLIVDDKVMLSLRRMVINQLLYQSTDKFNANSLTRQYIWYCLNDESYYKDKFLECTGLHLESYYKMACYFTAISCINPDIESEVIPFKHLIINLVPIFGPEQVKRFLELTCLKIDGVRDFIAPYKLDKNITAEYYEDTPFLSKPMFLDGDGVVILCKRIMKSGFVNLVPELFKQVYKESYKEKFGKTMELYISRFLDKYNYNFKTEREVKKIYSDNAIKNCKSVDFVISEGDSIVYIDSKAIEPAKFVKTSNNAQLLKERLNKSFIKGIYQGQECAFNLNKIEMRKPSSKDSMLIVVHRDHHISNAMVVQDFINPDLSTELSEKYHSIPIDLKRIYYITIDEFELLLMMCKQKELSINEFIDMCVEKDSFPHTQKSNLSMHIYEFAPEGIDDDQLIVKGRDLLIDDVIENMKESASKWSGKVDMYLKIKDYIFNW